MLTEAEKKWLETRLKNLKVSGWFSCTEGELIPLVNFHRKHLHSDWKDASEFEARVAKRLLLLMPCAGVGECVEPATTLTCDACHLKHARLAVEEEMKKNENP